MLLRLFLLVACIALAFGSKEEAKATEEESCECLRSWRSPLHFQPTWQRRGAAPRPPLSLPH